MSSTCLRTAGSSVRVSYRKPVTCRYGSSCRMAPPDRFGDRDTPAVPHWQRSHAPRPCSAGPSAADAGHSSRDTPGSRRKRGAAQAVAVMLRFCDVTITLAVLRNSAAVPIAVASHRSQILQRAIGTKGVHHFLKVILKFPGVELVFVMGPPGMVKSFSGRTEIHPHMAHCTGLKVPFFFHLNRTGPPPHEKRA